MGSVPRVLATALALAVAVGAGAAKRHAVLVGVGQYPALNEARQLEGPANDVQLLGDYLANVEGFAADAIVQLTDAGPRLPVRENVLDALRHLEESVVAGDFVLLYLSGHGSRQPATDAMEELDGYDEVFLPRDVRGWDQRIGAVENAITDDEIGAFIAEYRAKGADVWAIFDSCHSGTMTRGLGDELVRTRKVSEQELGIPAPRQSPPSKPRTKGTGLTGLPAFFESAEMEGRGQLIAFSAAHSAEETPEMELPGRGSPVFGLFTYALMHALSRRQDASYGELAESIMRFYSSRPHHKSKPQFYGTAMDRQVFGRAGRRDLVFRADLEKSNLSRASVRAGTLRGFDAGARVRIYKLASDEAAVGLGTVARATITESVVEIDWESDAERPSTHRIPVYARLLHPAFSPTVVVSAAPTVRPADNQRLDELVAGMAKDVPLARFVEGDPDADFHAAIFEDRFWLLQRGQSLPCRVRRFNRIERRECERSRQPEALFYEAPDKAVRLVNRAVRAWNLVKLQSASRLPRNLTVEVEIERGAGNFLSLHDDWQEHNGVFRAGDVLHLTIENRRSSPWDFHIFYVDSLLGISPVELPEQSPRIDAGTELARMQLGTITTDTVGQEALVVIFEPAPDGLRSSYAFLAQDRIDTVQTKGGTSAGDSITGGGLGAVLRAVWRGDQGLASRSLRGASEDGASVSVFSWTVE